MDPYDAVRTGMTPQRWHQESTLTRPLAMLSVANYLKQLGRNQVELLPGVKDERMIASCGKYIELEEQKQTKI